MTSDFPSSAPSSSAPSSSVPSSSAASLSAPSPPAASLTRFRDGSVWEAVAGYSRSARSGDVVAVSGTTAADGARLFPGDTYGQTAACLRQVIAAVEALGGRDIDIVRTRIMLVPGADVDGASRAHLEVLGHVAPANSLYFVAGLVGEGLLVEVEGDAVLVGGTAS